MNLFKVWVQEIDREREREREEHTALRSSITKTQQTSELKCKGTERVFKEKAGAYTWSYSTWGVDTAISTFRAVHQNDWSCERIRLITHHILQSFSPDSRTLYLYQARQCVKNVIHGWSQSPLTLLIDTSEAEPGNTKEECPGPSKDLINKINKTEWKKNKTTTTKENKTHR